MGRLRRKAWVIRARYPLKAVVQACMKCRRRRNQTTQQVMGDLPAFTLEKANPFRICSVDLFGPLVSRGLGGYGRKTFKCWGVIFACLASKAVAIWAAPSYDTDSFTMCLTKQRSIYGAPRILVADQGSQIKKTAAEEINWNDIQHASAHHGTCWKFTPPGPGCTVEKWQL